MARGQEKAERRLRRREVPAAPKAKACPLRGRPKSRGHIRSLLRCAQSYTPCTPAAPKAEAKALQTSMVEPFVLGVGLGAACGRWVAPSFGGMARQRGLSRAQSSAHLRPTFCIDG